MATLASREERDRGDHVPDALLPAALILDALELAGGLADRVREEHLTAGGNRRDARCKVYRRAEPVALALDGGAVVHPDPDASDTPPEELKDELMAAVARLMRRG